MVFKNQSLVIYNCSTTSEQSQPGYFIGKVECFQFDHKMGVYMNKVNNRLAISIVI